jgi:hypothetical protein
LLTDSATEISFSVSVPGCGAQLLAAIVASAKLNSKTIADMQVPMAIALITFCSFTGAFMLIA